MSKPMTSEAAWAAGAAAERAQIITAISELIEWSVAPNALRDALAAIARLPPPKMLVEGNPSTTDLAAAAQRVLDELGYMQAGPEGEALAQLRAALQVRQDRAAGHKEGDE